MLNSSNYVCDPKEVLNVGETIESEYDYKDPNVTVYYHRIPGAQTHMPDGAAIRFVGGQFATSNEEIKAFLNKIANKPGTQVYTDQERRKMFDAQLAKLADEASQPTGNAAQSLGSGQATPEMMQMVKDSLQSGSKIPSDADQALAVASLRKDGVAADMVKSV